MTFVLLERTVRRPLIDPAIFRNTTFTTAVAIGFLFNFCLYGSIFCLAVGLERLRGLDALETGFALLPMTVADGSDGAALRATRSSPGRVAGRSSQGSHSERPGQRSSPLNGSAANLGLLLVCTVPIGFTALAMPAMTGLAMASGPRLGLGLSAGVFNTSRQAGGALGVAVLGQRSPPVEPSRCVPRSCSWPARTDSRSPSRSSGAGVRTVRLAWGEHDDDVRASATSCGTSASEQVRTTRCIA